MIGFKIINNSLQLLSLDPQHFSEEVLQERISGTSYLEEPQNSEFLVIIQNNLNSL